MRRADMKPLQQYLDNLDSLVLEHHRTAAVGIAGATCDSRRVQPGWLFVAIPGARDDGTKYVADAVAAGAAAIVAEHPVEGLPPDVAVVRVSAAYPAAGRLAETFWEYPAHHLRLLGITGTKGKTTCAFLLRDMVARAGRKPGMLGTVEYDLGDGLPLPADRTTPTPFELQALLRRMVDHQVQDAVLEVSSHALDQGRLGTARLAGAVFTNLSGDHLDYHQTMDTYFAAKKRLFTECLKPGAPAVVNTDNDWGRRLADELAAATTGPTAAVPSPIQLIRFGRTPDCTARLTLAESSVHGSRLRIEFNTPAVSGITALELASPLMGLFNVYNVGAVAVLALALGLPAAAVAEAVSRCPGAPGRLQAITATNGIVAFVDYAHTDDALKNVLVTLRDLKPQRLLVLFGCGGDRDRTKRPRMGQVAAALADRLYLTSDNPRTEAPETIIAEIATGVPGGTDCRIIPDRRTAIDQLVTDSRPGDVLLLAGKGHETYQEQNGIKSPFDDLVEVQNAFRARGLM